MVANDSYYKLTEKSDELRLFLRLKSLERKRSRKYTDEDASDLVSYQLKKLKKRSAQGEKFLEDSGQLADSNKLIDKKNEEYTEKRTVDSVSLSVYGVYFKSVLGLLSPILILVLFAATQLSSMAADYWPLYWYLRHFQYFSFCWCSL